MKKFHLIALALSLAAAFALIQCFALIRVRSASARATKAQTSQSTTRARFGEQTALLTTDNGGPGISLKDGRDLITAYTSETGFELAMQQNQARPLALASADFDEDGVPDLISGYDCTSCSTNSSLSDISLDGGTAGTGLLTLHRGNVDAIYPNTVEAEQRKAAGEFTAAPFLSPAHVIEAPATPSFIGAGDFDADGHYDVVIAAAGGHTLHWLAGDGHGGFTRSGEIALPGTLTTLVTGEINRSDGLADVVVGIRGPNGAQALVFEGAEGALKREPESLALPATATALALGQLDDSYEMDLVVAAGSELVVVHGRDRKLSLDAESRAGVPAASVYQQTLPFAITSLVIGDFVGNYRAEVALLSADGVVHVLEREAKSEAWGRITAEVATASRRDANEDGSQVVNAAATNRVVLVRARVSVSGKDDLVLLNGANHQLQVIATETALQSKAGLSLASASPTLRVAASLDLQGEPVAVLPMRLTKHAFSDLVVLKTGGEAPVLIAEAAAGAAIIVNTSLIGSTRDNVLTINEAILIANGSLAVSTLTPAEQGQIAGTPANPGLDEVKFSGVTSITLTTGFAITDAITIDGGTSRVELSGGQIVINVSGCTVRGLVLNKSTVGAAGSGIRLDGGGNNFIENNYIGTDASGANPAFGTTGGGTSFWDGVSINSPNNMIGGTASAAHNVISTSSQAVRIGSNAPENKVQGNYIGTDASGTKAFGGFGISITSGTNTSPNQQIGGTEVGARNVIAQGIQIQGDSGLLVQGNFIGTDAAGSVALSSSTQYGVSITLLTSLGNTVGGTLPAARNIISGKFRGVNMSSATTVLVQGNYIGTDAAGTKALGNTSAVGMDQPSTQNTIGGTVAGARNILSGSVSSGIGLGGSNNVVQGNYIGTDASGAVDVGNNGFGIDASGSNHKIGGTEAGAANIIAFNKGNGVSISQSATGVEVRRNSIFANSGFGILFLNNVRRPLLNGTTGTLSGVAGFPANTTFTIEFFSNDICGASNTEQAKTFIGETTATTDANGNAAFNVPAGPNVTATANAPGANTSTVSNCIAGTAPTPTPTPTPTPAQINLNPTQLNFTAKEGGANPASQSVTLKNTGGSILNWQAAAFTNPPGGTWLSVSSPSGPAGSLAPNESTNLTVSVNISGLTGKPTPYQGMISIASSNASNSPQAINVALALSPAFDEIEIDNAQINGKGLNDIFNFFDGTVNFECDVHYTLVHGDPLLGGFIYLEATDFSGDIIGRQVARIKEPVARSSDGATKHLRLQFELPRSSFIRSFAYLKFKATLLNIEDTILGNDFVNFNLREWLVINEARANNQTVYSRDGHGGMPIAGPAGRIQLDLNLNYLLQDINPTTQVFITVYGSADGGPRPQLGFTSIVVPQTQVNLDISASLSFYARRGERVFVEVLLLDGLNHTIADQRFDFTFFMPPAADYKFQGTRTNTSNPDASFEFAGATSNQFADGSGQYQSQRTQAPGATPVLTDLIAPGSSTGNSFVTDTVDGASATVLKFPNNNGLALSPTIDIVSNNTYSIVMLLKFDEANKWRRIVDFKNGTSDNGLYADADNNLRFSPVATGSGGPIAANKYVQIAITRDASGVVTGYVDDAQQFQFTDTNNDAVIDSNNTLRFFQDNTSGGGTGESSAGSVARLRLYDRVLPAAEIAALDREPGSVQFNAASYNAVEGAGVATITVTRTGATSLPATVDYLTSDDTATQKSDYTLASGTLSFAAGETSKTFTVLLTDNAYFDGNRQLSLFLTNPSDTALSTLSAAVLTIIDNETAPPTTNPIDAAQFYVHQHYADFLNRVPDQGGLDFWTGQITSCGTDAGCIEFKRINVSAAYFLSIEFQQTGYLVERLYKAAYGDANGTSNFGPTHQLPVPIVRLNEFLPDTQRIGKGVIVGQNGWEAVLENNMQTFTAEFARRERFTIAFPLTMTTAQFVDKLNLNAGNPLTQAERDSLVNSGLTRAQILRAVAEDQDLKNAEFNRAFVLMQYFGYLRRNPNDPQDTDYSGFEFWLTKLNQFNGNFQNADMVKAFISSAEYRQRFGP